MLADAAADDAQLVEQARAGDEAAFGELVRRYSPALLRVARMFVATDADAGDVVQETWLGVPRRWDEDDPEQALRSAEALRIAREAIDRLPERQRLVITMRDLEGLSSDEGAQRPGPERDQPAGPAAPRTGEGAPGPRVVDRRMSRRWLAWRRRPAPSPSGLTCREVVELVTAYLDGALDAGERARFEAHLSACDGCTAYVQQLRTTIDVTGRLAPEALDPLMERALLDAFRDWKDGG